MAKNTSYGKPFFPSTGPYLFTGSFLQQLFSRLFQGGIAAEDTITAHVGGTQAAAYQLNNSLNRTTVVTTAADSVALPKAISGSILVLINSDSTDAQNVYAFPGSGDTINGNTTTTAFSQAAAKVTTFYCLTKGAWITSTAAIP